MVLNTGLFDAVVRLAPNLPQLPARKANMWMRNREKKEQERGKEVNLCRCVSWSEESKQKTTSKKLGFTVLYIINTLTLYSLYSVKNIGLFKGGIKLH